MDPIISEPQYFSPGIGDFLKEMDHASQAVRIGDYIELTAQAGWLWNAGIDKNVYAQIDKAFENAQLVLQAACGKGWSQVYEVKSFHVPPDEHAKDAMIKNSKKWMPDHCPIWTCVRVTRLQEVAINVEIEVWAYDPKGAKGGA